MKKTELLTDLEIRNSSYQEKRSAGEKGTLLGNRLPDGAGLYLFIAPTGGKSWRWDFKFHGHARILTYGKYPDLSLDQARIEHSKARLQLAQGSDPTQERKKLDASRKADADKARAERENTFQAIAAEWISEEIAAKEKSPAWISNTKRWLSWANEAFGNRPLSQIEAKDILSVMRKKAKAAPASAEFFRQLVSRVFAYGIRTLRVEKGYNPADAVKGAIIVPPKKHHKKLSAKELPALLADIQNYGGKEQTKIGLLLLLHVFPRKAELTESKWAEIDLDAALWTIPAERMKMKREHRIPLTPQVVEYFRRLKELAEGSPWVFPSNDSRRKDEPVSEQTFNIAFKAMKWDFGPHGTRSTAASILSDAGHDRAVIDAALAHSLDATRASYFRNDLLDRRRELMKAWSDMLDGFSSGGATILPLVSAA